jgi:hypothetical protein
MLSVAEQTLAINERANKSGQVALESLLAAQTMVEKHRGEVEKLETELKSLRGEFAVTVRSAAFVNDKLFAAWADGSVRVWDPNGKVFPYPLTDVKGTAGPTAPAVKATMLDRVKKLLDTEVEAAIKDVAVPDALHALLEQAKSDIPLRVLLREGAVDGKVTLTGRLTVGAWIEAIEDSDPAVRLVVRDYGLLLTTKDRRPDGALSVQDLWKGNYAELKKPEAPKQ